MPGEGGPESQYTRPTDSDPGSLSGSASESGSGVTSEHGSEQGSEHASESGVILESTTESIRPVVYESLSTTLSVSDSESSVSDSMLESMSAAETELRSESATSQGPRQSRIGSLLSGLNLFGSRG